MIEQPARVRTRRRRASRSPTGTLAASWAWELVSASALSPRRAELEFRLRSHLETLVRALQSEPFDPAPARRVGAALVELRATESDAVRRTLLLLSERLLDHVALSPEAGQYRLTRLLIELGIGWTDGIRLAILASQEDMRRAVEAARRSLAGRQAAVEPENPWFV